MTPREETLSQLINSVLQHPPSSWPWRKAVNRLLREIQQLPGLAKSSHPDYLEALDDTLMRLAEEIQDFQTEPENLEKSLVNWINLKLRLKYKVKNLHVPQSSHSRSKKKQKSARIEYKEQTRKPPLSLDVPLGEEGGETFVEQLADHQPATIWEQQALIAQEQKRRQNERIGVKLKEYIETDPEQTLRNCHPRAHPQGNCLVLSQRLLLKYPPDKLANVARDLKINYHTLNWHWQKKGLPLLRAIAIKLGYEADLDL